MSLSKSDPAASEDDSTGFGDELSDLSEAELAERANKSVDEFYNRSEERATEWRESILEEEAAASMDEFYSRTGGLSQNGENTLSEWRQSFLEDEAESAFDSHTELFSKSAKAHLENPEWQSRYGEFVDTEISQTGSTATAAIAGLFDDDQLGQAKGEALDIVAQNPDGVQFAEIVKNVLDDRAVTNATYQYKQLKDWIKASEYTQTSMEGGIWVKPSLHLSKQYADQINARQQGDENSNGETGEKFKPQYPKDRVKSILDKRVRLDDGEDGVDLHDYRWEILREQATELANIDDKWTIFERIDRAEYLLLKYTNRFNDVGRAEDILDGLNFALNAAAREYSNAVVLTVTVDPKRFDSHSAAVESITENKGRLMDWLAYQVAPGTERDMPENMSVLEFQENGLPHYHIVLFGCSWLTSQEQLSAKWSDLGVGSVVDARVAGSRNGSFIMHNDDGVTRTLKDYLGKSARELVELAGMSPAELQEQVENGDIHMWRQALYWATGKQYYSCSPDLKKSNDGDDVEDEQGDVTIWEFVGVARYEDIPAHVRQQGSFGGIPPPG